MQYISKLFATVAAFSLLFMIGCGGGDDNPTPDPDNGDGGVRGSAVIGTWVQAEPGDVTTPEGSGVSFEDFSITFSASDVEGVLDYSATNTNTLVFPRSGTFQVPADPNFSNGVVLTREDQTPVTVTLVGENQLRMEFTIESDSGIPTENSRVAQVVGAYNFLLTKQE